MICYYKSPALLALTASQKTLWVLGLFRQVALCFCEKLLSLRDSRLSRAPYTRELDAGQYFPRLIVHLVANFGISGQLERLVLSLTESDLGRL